MLTRRDLAISVILSLVTCGIYSLYWVYKLDEELKTELNNGNSPTLDLILVFVTCGLYTIYLMYRNAQQINEIQAKYNLPIKDDSIISLILSVIGLAIVALIIQQDAINKIIDSTGTGDYVDPLM